MSEPKINPKLPPELQQALDRFQRKWRFLSTLTLAGLLVLIPLLSFALLSISDRLWETPAWARFVLAVPVPMLMVLCLAPYVRRWVLDHPGPRRVARFMGRLDARVGDRLLGAVELADGGSESWAGSQALRQAAIMQVAAQLSDVHAEDRLDTRGLRKIFIGAGAVTVMVVLYLFLVPDAALNSFQRWLKPYQAIERFTFVRLTGFPDQLVVPHGEAFDFSGEVDRVDDQPVTEVLSKVNGPEQVEVALTEGKVRVVVEGMTQNREVTLSSGDAKTRVAVNPLLRPELIAMSASVKWPAYLERETEDVVMRRRRLEVPLGSEVAMKGSVSRDLASARIGDLEAMSITGAGFEMPAILVDTNLNLSLNWVDQVGLMPRQPAAVELIAKADLPPHVSMSGMGATVAVLQDEFLELDLSARDDYGLKEVWARFKQQAEAEGPAQVIEKMNMQGTSGAEKLTFSPERLGYGPHSMIELVALAVDAYPDRTPSESTRFRILVLSKEDHAKMLLQQMDRLLAELDESIRQEALSLEANKNTVERDESDIQNQDTAEKLLDRALDELVRAEQLGETHRGMESLIGEATKNDQITDEQIADWAEISEDLKNKALPAMTDAADAMKKAAAAQGDQADPADTIVQEQVPGEKSDRKENLEEAIRKQEEALAAMRKGEEDLNESLVNSLSESFINRFKVLANKQLEVRDDLTSILPKTIGLKVEQLPAELKDQLASNVEVQEQIYRESRYIFDDLEGFYRRTTLPEIREVTEAMKTERYTERLPELTQLIKSNTIGRTTSEASEWNRLFLAWADMLTDEAPGGGEGGGGRGDEEGETLETMIALIRAREQQEKLRRHTRELDESYTENSQYHRDAVLLSDRQYELAKTLIPLENRVVKDETKALVSLASGEMMNVGVQLRSAVTDQQTIAVQTAVIELLAKALDQSMGSDSESQQSEAQQNSAAMMQAIMQMMAGKSPGSAAPGTVGGEGSTGFGDPGRGDLSGAASGSRGERKSEGRAGASDPGNWPGRYRGMMDAYFEAIEGE